jgi:2-aminoadipate transaminase
MLNRDLTNLLSKRARFLSATPDEPKLEGDTIDFTFGHPDPEFFPSEQLKSAAANVLQKWKVESLQYSDFRGTRVLLDPLVSYLSQKLNMKLETKNLVVTNGSMQIPGLMSRVVVNPGDLVITEAPTYFRAVTVFRNHDALIEDVPIDSEGICVDVLDEMLADKSKNGQMPKLLYTVPTYQNPSGSTLPLERREKLLKLSSQFDFLILEDTAYNDLWYDSVPPPTLFELDNGVGRVIQMGTFSKIIAPGLAIGWAVGPKLIIGQFVEFKENGGTTPLTSCIVADFISDTNFPQHLDKLRTIYRQKRDAMIDALGKYMDGLVSWEKPRGGYFVWLHLSERIDPDVLWKNALSERVLFLPSKYCFARRNEVQPAVRLAFSNLTSSEIDEGIRRLSIALHRSIRN